MPCQNYTFEKFWVAKITLSEAKITLSGARITLSESEITFLVLFLLLLLILNPKPAA